MTDYLISLAKCGTTINQGKTPPLPGTPTNKPYFDALAGVLYGWCDGQWNSSMSNGVTTLSGDPIVLACRQINHTEHFEFEGIINPNVGNVTVLTDIVWNANLEVEAIHDGRIIDEISQPISIVSSDNGGFLEVEFVGAFDLQAVKIRATLISQINIAECVESDQ